MQSSYALGLAILSMAIAPKLMDAFSGKVNVGLIYSFGIFVTGFILNWFFTLVLWHFYWYIESKSPT